MFLVAHEFKHFWFVVLFESEVEFFGHFCHSF